MPRNILALTLMLSGVSVIIFGKQLEALIHFSQFLFLCVGLILFIVGAARLNLKAPPRYMSNEGQLVNWLKVHGDKIKVDLCECVIKENHYTEEIEDSEKYQNVSWGLNVLTGVPSGGLYPNDQVEHRNVIQSVILFEAPYRGKNIQFRSHFISKDKTTLLFHFYAQKETNIYMSPKDGNTYYFDLEFLYL
jgi:hypothetical protein